MRSFMLRLAGFAGAPLLSALAPFLILPVVSRVVGPDGWANFSSGQAIGTLGMVAVLFGWGVVGPVRVARAATPHERAGILAESIRSRLLTAIIAVPASALVAFAVSGDNQRTAAVVVAAALTLGGLSPAWYCIGEGNPRALMLFDVAPKLVASVLALPAILWSGDVIWYPVLLILFTVPVFALHALLVRAGHDPARDSRRAVAGVLASLVPTAAIDAAGNAYAATPIPIATSGLQPAEASSFASADRAYRIGLLAVIALGNAFQAWVLDPGATDHRRRHALAFVAQGALGVVGGLAIALLGPWATAIVFGAAVAAAPLPSALLGAAFFFIACSTPLMRNVLIPAGRYRLVLVATIASAIVGVLTMLWGAHVGSAPVIAVGVAAAEAVTLTILLVPGLRAWHAGS